MRGKPYLYLTTNSPGSERKMAVTLRCIIVDDDEIDRLATVSFVRQYPFLSITGIYSAPDQVLMAVQEVQPDVLFMDIDMPVLNGLELRDRLRQVPVCVFITSYSEYAVESFEKEAFDFLVKPITQSRFEQMVTRLHDYFVLRQKAALLDSTLGADSIFIKDGHDQVKINLRDILYLEALKDYTRIVTTERKHHILSSIGNLLKEKYFTSFIRIHRSYAVQREYIQTITASHVKIKNHELPIGRSYKDALKAITLLPS